MAEFVFFLGLVLVMGMVLGMYRVWHQMHQVEQQVQQFVDDIAAQTLIILDVELVDDQFLCYNSLTKEFVCMGRNMAEVQQRFQLRYPDKQAGIVKDDPVVLQLKAAV